MEVTILSNGHIHIHIYAYIFLRFFFFLLHNAACEILVPQPGTKRVPSALGAWSLNHWTSREVP